MSFCESFKLCGKFAMWPFLFSASKLLFVTKYSLNTFMLSRSTDGSRYTISSGGVYHRCAFNIQHVKRVINWSPGVQVLSKFK